MRVGNILQTYQFNLELHCISKTGCYIYCHRCWISSYGEIFLQGYFEGRKSITEWIRWFAYWKHPKRQKDANKTPKWLKLRSKRERTRNWAVLVAQYKISLQYNMIRAICTWQCILSSIIEETPSPTFKLYLNYNTFPWVLPKTSD